MVARIMLRQQFGREPTEDEVDGQVERIRDRTDPLPSLETITTAFENGDEVRRFSSIRSHSGHQPVYATESVSVEARLRRLRRGSTAGDRYRIPISREESNQTEGIL